MKTKTQHIPTLFRIGDVVEMTTGYGTYTITRVDGEKIWITDDLSEDAFEWARTFRRKRSHTPIYCSWCGNVIRADVSFDACSSDCWAKLSDSRRNIKFIYGYSAYEDPGCFCSAGFGQSHRHIGTKAEGGK